MPDAYQPAYMQYVGLDTVFAWIKRSLRHRSDIERKNGCQFYPLSQILFECPMSHTIIPLSAQLYTAKTSVLF